MKNLAGFAVFFICLWLLFSAYLWFYQEKVMFFPQPLDAAAKKKLMSFAIQAQGADNTHLQGWIIPKENAKTAIIYFGGNSQEISSTLMNMSEKLGITVAGFNYRGFGETQGKPTAEDLRSDALIAFDAAVSKHGIPVENWVVLGRSLGSHMAAYVAAKREIASVVLVTPYDSVTEVAARRYPIFPVRMMVRHPFNTVAETQFIKAPVLIVKSAFDRIVPHASTERLLNQWEGSADISLTTVPDTTHGDIDESDDYWLFINEFLKKETKEKVS